MLNRDTSLSNGLSNYNNNMYDGALDENYNISKLQKTQNPFSPSNSFLQNKIGNPEDTFHNKNNAFGNMGRYLNRGNDRGVGKDYDPNKDWSMKGIGGTALGVGQLALGLGSYFEDRKTARLQRDILRQQGEANHYLLDKSKRNDTARANAFRVR